MGSGSDALSYAMIAAQLSQALNKGGGGAVGQPGQGPAPSLATMGGTAGPLFSKLGQSNNVGVEALIQEILRKKMSGEMGPGGTPMLARGSGSGADMSGFPGVSGYGNAPGGGGMFGAYGGGAA